MKKFKDEFREYVSDPVGKMMVAAIVFGCLLLAIALSINASLGI